MLYLLCAVLFTASCAGGKLQNSQAQQAIARKLDVAEKNIHVNSISSLSDTALVDAMFHATFVLQRDSKGNWNVVRMQHAADRWETPEEFLKTVGQSPFRNSLELAFQTLLIEPKVNP